METKHFKADSAQSLIGWTGKKVTGTHNGTIAIREGNLTITDGRLSGGNFYLDVRSIKILDVEDPATNAQFAGHLFSDDFFAAECFPEALFVISSVTDAGENNYQVTGNLTIKGITHPLSFPAKVTITDQAVIASGKMIIDRTKYDMKFRSGNFFTNLGDTLIYNEFELDVTLHASLTI